MSLNKRQPHYPTALLKICNHCSTKPTKWSVCPAKTLIRLSIEYECVYSHKKLQYQIKAFTFPISYSCKSSVNQRPGPEVIKLFPCSNQLSKKFILLINFKMPTIVGILIFISMINTTSESFKARHFFICRYFSFYELLKFRAQLS